MSMAPPVVQTINDLPEESDDRNLFIRLHLDYVRYGQLEDLIDIAISAMEERVKKIENLAEVPDPLNQRDLQVVVNHALQEVSRAKELRESVRRKKT